MKSFLAALSTLTLIPVPSFKPSPQDIKNSPAYYPFIGALLGLVLVSTHQLRLSNDLIALMTLLLWIIMTGALHLDGLGDCVDGLFGGRDPVERRRIMKDPALGVYGITGIVLVILCKYVLLSHLLAIENFWKYLILVPMAGRWSIMLSCTIGQAPPEDRGLGSQVVGLPVSNCVISTLMSIALGIIIMGLPCLAIFAISALLSIGIYFFSKSRIAGLTGDGLGATVEITEVILLFYGCVTLHTVLGLF